MADIDDRIRRAFEELAEPASNDGVMDALRRRRGDQPPSAEGDGGNGANGGSSGPSAGFLGGLAAVVLLGAAVGVGIGLLTRDDGSSPSNGDELASIVLAGVPGRDCPDGEVAGRLLRGDRVVVVSRSEDGAWLGVRDPERLTRTLWVDADVVDTDGPTDGVRVGSCGNDNAVEDELALDTTTSTLVGDDTLDLGTTSSTTPDQTTGGGGGDGGGGGGGGGGAGPTDTVGPSLANVGIAPGDVWEEFPGLCVGRPRDASITAFVTDPSGVASVRASWSIDGANESVALTGSSGTYRATFGPFPYLTVPDGTSESVTVTIVARDTRGNTTSTTRTVVVHSAGECFG